MAKYYSVNLKKSGYIVGWVKTNNVNHSFFTKQMINFASKEYVSSC